jgi:hypothetical protein
MGARQVGHLGGGLDGWAWYLRREWRQGLQRMCSQARLGAREGGVVAFSVAPFKVEMVDVT